MAWMNRGMCKKKLKDELCGTKVLTLLRSYEQSCFYGGYQQVLTASELSLVEAPLGDLEITAVPQHSVLRRVLAQE